MVRTSLVAAGVLVSALPIFAAETKTYDYTAFPEKTWVQVGAPTKEVPYGILAYSGMCVDTAGKQILVFGGGHNDYYGNEVWSWHIPTRTWKRLTDPTSRAKYETTKWDWDNTPGMFPDLKVPVSRHTYDSVVWVAHMGQMYAAAGSTWSEKDQRLWTPGRGYTQGATGPHKDKGWGAIAKDLGIKPGSKEFKALKDKSSASADKAKKKKK